MQPDLREANSRFVAELQRSSRRRIPLPQIRQAFGQACPELAEQAERRHILKGLIQEAVEQGICRLPRDARARDRLDSAGLPLFVVLNRSAVPRATVIPPGYAWHPLLGFAVEERSRRRLECLKAINEWLKGGPDLKIIVPIKERSLEIFENEKKLDRLRAGSQRLLGGRLALADLGCRICPLPLPFEMGPPCAKGRPVLVIENHDTWYSFCTWNESAAQYSCVAYAGGGHRKGLAYDEGFLDELLHRAGACELKYFGDVDPAGISIAAGVARSRAERGVARLTPAVELYVWLLSNGPRRPMRSRQRQCPADLEWLPDTLRPEVSALFEAGLRIPQEALGTRVLKQTAAFAEIFPRLGVACR